MNTLSPEFSKIVNEQLVVLRNRTPDKWKGSQFEVVKHAGQTQKGDFGEAITEGLLNQIGIPAEIINGGKGEFDILIKDQNVFIEHKLATEDVNDCFQFNGIKKNVHYDYVFCLGVSPEQLWFNIFPKSVCENLTVSMTKGGSDSYKLTAKPFAKGVYTLLPLTKENFKREVEKIV